MKYIKRIKLTIGSSELYFNGSIDQENTNVCLEEN